MLSVRYGTVENSLSYKTWNCELTCPVRRFSTKVTQLAWHGECPKYIPARVRGSHFGVPIAPWLASSRIYTGQPQVWNSVGSIPSSVPVIFSRGLRPSVSSERRLCLSTTDCMVYGYSAVAITSGHFLFACSKIVCAP